MIDFECLWKKTPFCHKLFSSDKFGRSIKTLWKYLLVLPLCISKEIPLRLRSVRTIGRDLTISKSAYKPQAVLGSLPTHPILSLISCYLSPHRKGPFTTLSTGNLDFWSPRPRRNNLFIMTWFSLSWEFLKKEIHLHIHLISQLNLWLRELIRCLKKNWEDLSLKIWRRVGPSFHYSRGSPGQNFLNEQKTAFLVKIYVFNINLCSCVGK
jgi:hypothetical protein